MKKILATIIIGMLAMGFNVVPAEAYTPLAGPVAISAEGEVTGVVAAFAVSVVTQSSGAAASLVFETASGETADSGEALKINGGTNEVDSRIIIYTDNDNNTNTIPTTVDASTGIDGSGLVGRENPGFTVAMLWGVETAAAGGLAGPNRNVDYTFDGTAGGAGDIYIVDTRHTHSFTAAVDFPLANGWNETNLDNNTLYKLDGTAVANASNDDLYPQLFLEDLYDRDPTVTPGDEVIVSGALYSSIATVCFGLGDEGTADTYVCLVPDITTPDDPSDTIVAKITPTTATTPISLYLYMAANFVGKPAQIYSTDKLYVEMVQD